MEEEEIPQPKVLRRSRTDRVVSGVAGGLGDYFSIDPVVVRLAFVLVTLLGGSGMLLYLVAWSVIAKEGNEESSAVRALRGSPDGNRALLFLVLAIAAVIVLNQSFFWSGFGIGNGLTFPLLLIGLGVTFFVWPGDRFRDSREEVRTELTDAKDEVMSELVEERERWRHGYRQGTHRGDRHTRREQRHQQRRARKEAPFVGPMALAAMILIGGVATFADQADWINLDPAVMLATGLVIIGVALIATAWWGRARGLILLGVALLPVAWAVAVIDLTWWDGIGEERATASTLDELDEEYRYGIGEFIVDLSDLDLEGQRRSVAVGLTIGEAIIYVPDTLDLSINVDGRMGEIRIEDGPRQYIDDGIHITLDQTAGTPGADSLHLDFEVGIGSGIVKVCTNVDTDGYAPCP